MSLKKPLKLAVCLKCGTKFFVRDPTPGPHGGDMRIHEAAPPVGKDTQVVPIHCPACNHPLFAEFPPGS